MSLNKKYFKPNPNFELIPPKNTKKTYNQYTKKNESKRKD